MRTIQIDEDVYRQLQRKAIPFEEPTPNETLRRLLGIAAQPGASAAWRGEERPADETLTPDSLAPISTGVQYPRLATLPPACFGKAPLDPSAMRKKPKASLPMLVEAGLLEEGQTLYLHDYDGSRVPGSDFEATVAGKRILWKENGQSYSLSALAIELLRKRGHRGAAVRGPGRWFTRDEVSVQTLWDQFLKMQKGR